MKKLLTLTALLLLVIALIGCESTSDRLADSTRQSELTSNTTLEAALVKAEAERCPDVGSATAPATVTVPFAGNQLEFWPYTGTAFDGEPQDPINLIFVGKSDPRDLRAALLALDGDRSAFGFPPVAPFNARWEDAIGDVQTGYLGCDGWTGGVIQLACGDYQQARFHVRFFRNEAFTIANVHFEVLIPNTTEHQVLSWELAEQFLTVDLLRTGLLAPALPMTTTDVINQSPFRTIPTMIYNGLPVELRQLIGGPLGNVTEDVPINTDGRAAILNLAGRVNTTPGTFVQDFVINFDQVIPKPFCSAGPLDYVYVNGPVHLEQTTRVDAWGKYCFDFRATGRLTVTPFDIQAGQPSGESYQAVVRESHSGLMNSLRENCSSSKIQRMTSDNPDQNGLLIVKLRVGCGDACGYQKIEHCGNASRASL